MQSASPTLQDSNSFPLGASINDTWSVLSPGGHIEIPQACELISQRQLIQTPENLVRQLSELNVKLYDCCLTVPPQTIHGNGPEALEAIKLYSSFSLEEVISLTQSMINLYPLCMIALFGSVTKRAGDSSDIEVNNSSDPSTTNSVEDNVFPMHLTEVDHSAVLLVLSCHLRLISIWEQLLQHMAVSLSQSGGCFHTISQAPDLQISNFRLGSYVPPISITVSMHMLLFSTHFRQLHSYVDELSIKLQAIDDAVPSKNFSPGAGAMSLKAAADVKERASGISSKLKMLINVLVETGVIEQLS
jgi:hypothetical protein